MSYIDMIMDYKAFRLFFCIANTTYFTDVISYCGDQSQKNL